MKRFLTEATVLLGIGDHENIVRIVGVCTDTHQQTILMEYVSGGNLEDIIYAENESAFDCWDNRLDVAFQVAKGMEFLHCRDDPIVHRDLKPTNICVSTAFGRYHCKVQ